MVTAAALINLLIYILIIGLILWVVLYAIQSLPLPPPFGQVARVVVLVVAVIILILLLLDLIGAGPGVRLVPS